MLVVFINNVDLSRKCSKDTYIKLQHTGVNKNVVSGVICIPYDVPTLKKMLLESSSFYRVIQNTIGEKVVVRRT